MEHFLFIDGIRVSTMVMAAALVIAGTMSRRKPWRGVVAGLVWILGFESAWHLTAHLTGSLPGAGAWFLLPLLVVGGWLLGVRPDWRVAALTVALWALWVAIGFPYNTVGQPSFSGPVEALNEATKTAWGLAYLIPLLRGSVLRKESDAVERVEVVVRTVAVDDHMAG